MFNNKAEAILPSTKISDVSSVRSLMEASERLATRTMQT